MPNIPRQRPGQSLAAHQAEVAAWLGTDVATMNRDHDALHRSLSAWLGTESLALMQAAGEPLSEEEAALAAFEEEAVLHLQRWVAKAGLEMPA